MRASLGDYIRAAFNARPIGMLVPPNWIALGGFALLGLINPGFWVIGAGLELGYLFVLSTNPRFQNVVSGTHLLEEQRQRQSQMRAQVDGLSIDDRRRYDQLEQRCQAIIAQQRGPGIVSDLQSQSEGLGRLLWIFLRLLLTRQSITRLLRESASGTTEGIPLNRRIAQLEDQLKRPELGEELKKSLSGQLEILQQRLQSQNDARQKLDFLEAELTRIQEQVELIREQAVFNTDPAIVSQRIDQIAATLGGTQQWIREQQQLYGRVEDLLSDPPAVMVPAPASSAQEAVKQAQ